MASVNHASQRSVKKDIQRCVADNAALVRRYRYVQIYCVAT